MGIHPLYSARLKLSRAEKHAHMLEDRFDRFLKSKPYSGYIEFDPKIGKHRFGIRPGTQVPDDWAIIIGEFAHNARSAMEAVVWQLAIKQLRARNISGDPKPKPQCPIADARTDKRGDPWHKKLQGLSSGHIARIEKFQPFMTGDLLRDYDPADPLRVLREINNIDKHRAVLLAVPIAFAQSLKHEANVTIEFEKPPPRWFGFDASADAGAEIEFGVAAIRAPKGTACVYVELELGNYPTFNDADTGLPHLNVLDTVKAIIARVTQFIDEFAPDFP